MLSLDSHLENFKQYVSGFSQDNERDREHIQLKIDHSLRVLDEAVAITEAEAIDGREQFLIHLAALYHDLGRFEQYNRFKTYKDSQSVNHARQGFEDLKKSDFLQKLDKQEQRMILWSVLLHNRKELPARLSPALEQMTNVVRDADKLDIIPVVLSYVLPGHEHNEVITLGLRPHPDNFSAHILQQVTCGKNIDYRDMVWVNDFKLLLCSWAYTLNFAHTRREILKRGHIEQIFALLPDKEEVLNFKEQTINYLKHQSDL